MAHVILHIFIHSQTSCATIKIKWNKYEKHEFISKKGYEHEYKQTSGNRGGLARRMLVSALSHDLVFKHHMSWSVFLLSEFR